jgi:hypothetical protein
VVVFSENNAKLLCGFVENIGLKSAFMVELSVATRVIEIANNKNWPNL